MDFKKEFLKHRSQPLSQHWHDEGADWRGLAHTGSQKVRVAAGAALLLLLLVTLVASGSASRQFLDPQDRFVSEAELIQQQEQKMLAEEQKMMEQDAGRDDAGRDQATSHLCHHLAAACEEDD